MEQYDQEFFGIWQYPRERTTCKKPNISSSSKTCGIFNSDRSSEPEISDSVSQPWHFLWYLRVFQFWQHCRYHNFHMPFFHQIPQDYSAIKEKFSVKVNNIWFLNKKRPAEKSSGLLLDNIKRIRTAPDASNQAQKATSPNIPHKKINKPQNRFRDLPRFSFFFAIRGFSFLTSSFAIRSINPSLGNEKQAMNRFPSQDVPL